MSISVPQVVKIVSMDVSRAYEELKKLLRETKCRIVEEEPPNKIVVEHGSILAFSPINVEKVVTFTLTPVDSTTRIVATTSITSDYKNIVIFNFVVAAIISILWILGFLLVSGLNTTLDLVERLLQDALQNLPPYTEASIRIQLETTLARLRADIEFINAVFNAYLFFVIIMMVVGAVLDIYIYWKRNSFAEKILKLMP
jgi:uncharacterized protein YneF (UPF0154 family)